MLEEHLARLSKLYPLWIGEDPQIVIVGGIKLPWGYNRTLTQLLIEIPDDYPLSPPGIGQYEVFIYSDLRYRGRVLRDMHIGSPPEYETPDFGPWAWWCYEAINWNPKRDNLTTFVGMFRADLTNPSTIQELSE
jgi:ubiquitin-protein ligase